MFEFLISEKIPGKKVSLILAAFSHRDNISKRMFNKTNQKTAPKPENNPNLMVLQYYL